MSVRLSRACTEGERLVLANLSCRYLGCALSSSPQSYLFFVCQGIFRGSLVLSVWGLSHGKREFLSGGISILPSTCNKKIGWTIGKETDLANSRWNNLSETLNIWAISMTPQTETQLSTVYMQKA